jgi:hypothetical protein
MTHLSYCLFFAHPLNMTRTYIRNEYTEGYSLMYALIISRIWASPTRAGESAAQTSRAIRVSSIRRSRAAVFVGFGSFNKLGKADKTMPARAFLVVIALDDENLSKMSGMEGWPSEGVLALQPNMVEDRASRLRYAQHGNREHKQNLREHSNTLPDIQSRA